MTTSIKHIREFHSPVRELFPDAQELPEFFKTNLVDDLRVVKYFHKDPQANIRIFYYQYLKLCFEIDNVDYESYIEKIYELIRTEGFEFYFEPNDLEKDVKNAQYKSLLIDFFELMNTSSMTIDNVLREYPILNDVFTNFFRTVVMIASITPSFDAYIDKNELFDFLSSFFSVDISSYDKCLKFVESDIFVYEEDQYNIYMAYIAEELEEKVEEQEEDAVGRKDNVLLAHEMKTVKEDEFESEISANTEENQPPNAVRLVQHSATNSSLVPSPDYTPSNTLKPRAKTIIKESYIESEFADYTSFSNNISNLGNNLPISYEKEVFVEELEPNSTVNETEADVGENWNNMREEEKALNVKEEEEIAKGNKLLTRVQSAQNNNTLLANATMVETIETIEPVLYTSLQKEQQLQQLSKATSQPNFLYREKSLQELAESCYESHESNIKPDHFEEIPEHESYGDSRHSSYNTLPGGNEKLMKKNIVSLGLEQSNMYVSYEEPTKDPGFTYSAMERDLTARHVEESSNEQIPSYNSNNYPSIKPIHSVKESSTTPSNNPTYQLDEPLFYMPKPTYSPSFPNSRMVESLNSEKEPFYSANIMRNTPASTFQPSEKLKLNVTKEFTNSIVMKSMSEPYKSEVQRTRERARDYRKNIYQQILNVANTNADESNNKNTYNAKKVSIHTNLSSETSLKTLSTNNLTTTTKEQLSPKASNKMETSQQQQSQPQPTNIYPVSMVKKQEPKIYSNTEPLTKTPTSIFNLENTTIALSKISEIKEISEAVSSSQSKKTIENKSNERITQEQNFQSQSQSNVKVSIYQSVQETNNTYKLPIYQPVLTGKKPVITQQQQPVYQQQQSQPVYQSQLHQSNFSSTQTVMPHYHHSSINQQQKTSTQQPQISNQTPRTYSQTLLSLLPQAQKPLPLYVPFERRK